MTLSDVNDLENSACWNVAVAAETTWRCLTWPLNASTQAHSRRSRNRRWLASTVATRCRDLKCLTRIPTRWEFDWKQMRLMRDPASALNMNSLKSLRKNVRAHILFSEPTSEDMLIYVKKRCIITCFTLYNDVIIYLRVTITMLVISWNLLLWILMITNQKFPTEIF